MPDLILRDIPPALVARVRLVADARGTSLEEAMLELLDRGLACGDDRRGRLDDGDARALQEAIAALESVPSDPGFALIGRAVPPPTAARAAPDQAIAAEWTPPPMPPMS